jgi:GTP-binding protein HflX
LEEVNEADLLLHVIDASRPVWEEQRQVVDQVLAELGAAEKPVLYVFSKIDAVPEAELAALRERIGNLLPSSSVFVSSLTEGGLDPLRRALLVAARKGTQIAEVRLPAGDGKLLAEIYRTGNVLSQRTENGQLVLRARLDKNVAGRLARAGASVSNRLTEISPEADRE